MKMIKEKLIPIDVDLINKFMKIEEVQQRSPYRDYTYSTLNSFKMLQSTALTLKNKES